MNLLLYNGINICGLTSFVLDGPTPLVNHKTKEVDGEVYTGPGFELFIYKDGRAYLDQLGILEDGDYELLSYPDS